MVPSSSLARGVLAPNSRAEPSARGTPGPSRSGRPTVIACPGPASAPASAAHAPALAGRRDARSPAHDRRPEHLLDAGGAGGQHHQPVEAERDAAGLRHVRRGRPGSPRRADSARRRRAPSPPSRPEAPALLGGIGELAEAVGELDAAGIELEALGHARVVGRRPGQRRLGRPGTRTGSSAGRGRAAARPSPPARG